MALQSPPRSFYAMARSQGADAEYLGDSYVVGAFEVTDYGQDIVWADGSFIRAPAS